jgi:hypothetical protein
VVAKAIVPGYSGNSGYLLLTKYNHYASTGGNGKNYVAITDPNTPMIDPITGVSVMNVVMEQIGADVRRAAGRRCSRMVHQQRRHRPGH